MKGSDGLWRCLFSALSAFGFYLFGGPVHRHMGWVHPSLEQQRCWGEARKGRRGGKEGARSLQTKGANVWRPTSSSNWRLKFTLTFTQYVETKSFSLANSWKYIKLFHLISLNREIWGHQNRVTLFLFSLAKFSYIAWIRIANSYGLHLSLLFQAFPGVSDRPPVHFVLCNSTGDLTQFAKLTQQFRARSWNFPQSSILESLCSWKLKANRVTASNFCNHKPIVVCLTKFNLALPKVSDPLFKSIFESNIIW